MGESTDCNCFNCANLFVNKREKIKWRPDEKDEEEDGEKEKEDIQIV